MNAVCKSTSLLASAAALVLGTSVAASAGGYTPAVVEPVMIEPVLVAPVGDWQGGYAGLTLGYAFSGSDRVGVSLDGDYQGDVGELDLNGVNAGIRVGYRWQRDRWVFGPELGFEGGDISDEISGSEDGLTAAFEGKVKNVLALRFKTGYAVRPDVLVYGIAGVARADIDYTISATLDGESGSRTENVKRTGYVVGLGVEKQFTERMSATAEYEYANFGKEQINFGPLSSEATPKYNNIKLGVNFKF